MKRTVTTGSDARPRVYLRPTTAGVDWSLGPGGLRRTAPSPGAAFEAAIEEVGGLAAVVFWEPDSASRVLAEHMGGSDCG
jgi:hypothetical protein